MTTDVDAPTGSQVLLPFGWEPPPGTVEPEDQETYFRFPAADDPNPGTGRVLAMSLYAALLGLAGLALGARGLIGSVGGGVPGWFVPLLACYGLVSVGLSVGAFLSIHRAALPWLLLCGATVPLGAAGLLAVTY